MCQWTVSYEHYITVLVLKLINMFTIADSFIMHSDCQYNSHDNEYKDNDPNTK